MRYIGVVILILACASPVFAGQIACDGNLPIVQISGKQKVRHKPGKIVLGFKAGDRIEVYGGNGKLARIQLLEFLHVERLDTKAQIEVDRLETEVKVLDSRNVRMRAFLFCRLL